MAEARTTPSGARLRPRRGLLRALVLATLLLLAAAVLGSQRDPDVDVPALAEAAISPDGSLIAFTARSGDDLDLFVVDALGRRPPRRLAGGDLFEQGPVFSPDGKRLLFLRAGASEWGMAEGELWCDTPGRPGGQAEGGTRSLTRRRSGRRLRVRHR